MSALLLPSARAQPSDDSQQNTVMRVQLFVADIAPTTRVGVLFRTVPKKGRRIWGVNKPLVALA